ARGPAIQRPTALQQPRARGGGQVRNLTLQTLPHRGQTASCVIVTDRRRSAFRAPMASLQKLPFRFFQAETLFIQLLLPPVDAVHHARKGSVLCPLRQFL